MQRTLLAAAGVLTVAFMLPASIALARTERAVPIPAAAQDVPASGQRQVAILAGGCFWGVEAVFEQLRGVRDVTAGYAGGTASTANYEKVSTETTRHAEAVRIVYDPSVVSYATLLRIYFSVAHDPTQVNRQGPDSGPSYRSAIFPQSPAQAAVAKAYIAQLSRARAYAAPIATRIEAGRFFPAEAYHQNFFRRNPTHPYIMAWDKPKVAALKTAYPKLLG